MKYKRNGLLDRIFIPCMSNELRNEKYIGWKKAVERSMEWCK
nr:hypothetical protein [Lutispora sp.]